MTVQDDSKRKL